MRNPRRFAGYGEHLWGVTASAGPAEPGGEVRRVRGRRRRFWGYLGRGVPFGPDDGTLSPWAVVASLPFAPEIVLPAIAAYRRRYPQSLSEYGFFCGLNPTYPGRDSDSGHGWVSEGHYGLDQGPVVLMIENYRSGLLWRLMRGCPYLVAGLRRAGFTGGWLPVSGKMGTSNRAQSRRERPWRPLPSPV
jgi:hypothetical protein